MKKILASIMALTLALSLAACGETETTPVSSENAPVSSQAPSSQAPVSSTISIAPPSEIPSEPAEDSKNLALKGTAIADSVSTQWSTNLLEYANDGNLTTRWQSNAKGNEGDDGWIGICWEEAQTFDSIVIDWETAHPAKDGFKVQTSEDGETWTDVEFTFERTGEEADDHQKDNITFEALTSKYIRVYCFKSYVNANGDVKNEPSAWEFEVYNSADLEDETVSEEAAESTDETVAE